MDHFRAARWMMAAVLAGAGVTYSKADTPGQAAPPPQLPGATLVQRDPVATASLLGTTYKSEVDGIQITPPADARVIKRSGLDLMSFVVDNKSWGGSVQLIRLPRSMALDEFIKTTKAEVTGGAAFHDGKVLREDYQRDRTNNRAMARIDFSMTADLTAVLVTDNADHTIKRGGGPDNQPARPEAKIGIGIYRQELVVQTAENEFITLIMYTPLADKEAATKTFEAMLPEFQIFQRRELISHRAQAIKDGKEWLASISAEVYATKMIKEPLFYRIIVNNKDVGFFKFQEAAKEQDARTKAMVDVQREGRKGVLFRVNYWSFLDDGTINFGLNEAFWGNGKSPDGTKLGDYFNWSNISETQTKVPVPINQQMRGQPAMQTVTPWIQETGTLIQKDSLHQLVVSLSGDKTQRLPEGINRIMPAEGGAPLPKILEYTWPRFVDLTKPAEMTFSVYDSSSHAVTNRTLKVLGQDKQELVKIGDRQIACYKCVDEVDPRSTTIWVTLDGRIQMMKTSDQSVMIPTTEQEMLALWKNRLPAQ